MFIKRTGEMTLEPSQFLTASSTNSRVYSTFLFCWNPGDSCTKLYLTCSFTSGLTEMSLTLQSLKQTIQSQSGMKETHKAGCVPMVVFNFKQDYTQIKTISLFYYLKKKKKRKRKQKEAHTHTIRMDWEEKVLRQ